MRSAMRWSAPSRASVACDGRRAPGGRAAVAVDGRCCRRRALGPRQERRAVGRTGPLPGRAPPAEPERHEVRVAFRVRLDRHRCQATATRGRDRERRGRLVQGRILELAQRHRGARGRSPGPGRRQDRLEVVRVGAAADHRHVVGTGPDPQLLDDCVHDGIGGHRAGQAAQDPGERLGLGPPGALAFHHAATLAGRRQRHHADEDEHDEIQAAGVEGEAHGLDRAQDQERQQQGAPGQGPHVRAKPAIDRGNAAESHPRPRMGPDGGAGKEVGPYCRRPRPGTSVLPQRSPDPTPAPASDSSTAGPR